MLHKRALCVDPSDVQSLQKVFLPLDLFHNVLLHPQNGLNRVQNGLKHLMAK
jgi:hypothetical protein